MVLSPLLFLLFVNGMTYFTTDGWVLNMYADVMIHTSAETDDELQQKFQRYVDDIGQWYFRNK